MIQELDLRDPRGCSAVVESELLASGDNAVVSEVIFDCRRRCDVFQRKELLGTRSQVDQETTTFVRSIVENGCLKLEELKEYSVDIPTGFLPPLIEL